MQSQLSIVVLAANNWWDEELLIYGKSKTTSSRLNNSSLVLLFFEQTNSVLFATWVVIPRKNYSSSFSFFLFLSPQRHRQTDTEHNRSTHKSSSLGRVLSKYVIQAPPQPWFVVFNFEDLGAQLCRSSTRRRIAREATFFSNNKWPLFGWGAHTHTVTLTEPQEQLRSLCW